MRALITGVTGFAGSHLADNLLAHGVEVVGTTLKGEKRDNIRHAKGKIKVVFAALEDSAALLRW